MEPRPPVLEICHSVPGRLRLRPTKALEAEALTALAQRLASVAGVARVISRPNTGSLIVEFAGATEALQEKIAELGIARLRAPDPPPPIGQVAQLGLLRADMALQDRTGKTLDLNSAVTLLLIAGAIVQLARGQVAGPATSLLMGALTMLERGRKF